MKIEKETTTKYYEYYCDICKNTTQFSNVTTLIVEDEDNYNYGDCYYYKTYNFDICEDCLKNKIFPYIKEITGEEPGIEIVEG